MQNFVNTTFQQKDTFLHQETKKHTHIQLETRPDTGAFRVNKLSHLYLKIDKLTTGRVW